MLSSVFNRRKVQQKLNNLANRPPRPQSPPSPASFESPEIVDINDKNIIAAHIQQASAPGPLRTISPQVQLDLRRSGSVSDWFPADFLRGEHIAPPERGASLAVGGLASANGSQRLVPLRNRSLSNGRELFTPDDVIVIEAEPKPENAEEGPLQSVDGELDTTTTPPRKAAPTPIIIPENPAALKVTLQRSASASGAHSSSGDLSANPSRPVSTYSDISSAVSGTTIARALVANSFIVSNGSHRSQSEFRGVSRQDSATLPKGEHPFLTSPYWRDKKISNGEIVANDDTDPSIPPVPPMPDSAELAAALDSANRSQRNSTSVAEARRQSEARLNGAVSPEASGSGSYRRSRAGSLTKLQKEQFIANRVSTISEVSSHPSPRTPALSIPGDSPTTVRSRASLNSSSTSKHHSGVSTSSERHPTSSSTSLHHDDGASSHKHHSGSSTHSGSRLASSRDPLEPPHSAPLPNPYNNDSSGSPAYSPNFPNPHPSPQQTESSVYSPQSTRTGTSKTTDPTSIASPGSSSMGILSPDSFTMYRSNSDGGGSRATPSRPMITVPAGERPHSVPVSASPLSATMGNLEQHKPFRPSGIPVSARLPGDSPMDSPDWLAVMVPESALIMNPPTSIRRSGSHLPPITVPSGDEDVFSSEHSFSTESESAARQTFPETPYAFSPLVSAGFAPPTYPNHMKNSPRTASLRGMSSRGRVAPSRALLRSLTSAKSLRTPESAEGAKPEPPVSPPSSMLSAIEESTPSTPVSQLSGANSSPERPEMRSRSSSEPGSVASPQSKYSVLSPAVSDTSAATGSSAPQQSPTPPASTPPTTTTSDGQQSRRSSAQRQDVLEPPSSSIPAKRPLTPTPSPLSSVKDLPPPSPRSSRYSDGNSVLTASPTQRTIHISTNHEASVQIPPAEPSPPIFRDGFSLESTPSKRGMRTRPAPPSGPRRPSAPTMLLAATRARNGSVTSLHSNSSRQQGPSFSASHPRFQTTPIRFRGLTLEQAQWTLSSQDLQSIVSKSIRQWADPASIRLLPPDVLLEKLADEHQKLEVQSSELRTSYKLAVRKRRALLSSLSNAMDAGEFQDQAALIRTTEELKEVSDNLDRISEELYSTTDQLMQVKHLEDVHNSSALGMALRKLNTSFIKHMQDNHALRQRISELEAERDEGWSQAEAVAQELEAKDPNTRRASRVLVARKNSMRASKAGLRSPSRHRSQRSSGQSSARNSLMSPALRSAQEEIPPVPPIPGRKSLGIVTTDLPIRSPGLMSSEYTPTSEAVAMQEAQRELCEMLGISLEELQLGTGLPRRRVSASDVIGQNNLARARRNSDVVVITPAMSKDEQRAAVLASIGMIPHEI